MKALLLMFLIPILSSNAQIGFDSRIAEAVEKLQCAEPDETHPVTLNAQIVKQQDSIAVIVKCRIAPGWHIYDYVSPTLPYIAIENIFQLPQNIRSVGTWKKTASVPSAMDPGVTIYEQEAVFIHKALRLESDTAAGGIIKTGLYYQTCNLRQCLRPVETTFSLSY